MQMRPRRLRLTDGIRRITRETRLSADALIYPLFVKEGINTKEPIAALDGQYHYSPDRVCEAVENSLGKGVGNFLLFGLPGEKDEIGSGAWQEDGVVQLALRALRGRFGHEITLITDVCLCEYTSHGHCGVLRGQGSGIRNSEFGIRNEERDGQWIVDNDETLPLLARTAVSHALAGADIVAPSDMMDGRVKAIREALDCEGCIDTAILSYAVKYASSFYGPFRDAAGSAPSFGDRKTYQMDWHNKREALKEALIDEQEGADILMVKPALGYGDVIAAVRSQTNLPLCAYSVSGEYAMIKAAAKMKLIDEYGAMCESAVSAFRAGADLLITYYANEIASAIYKGDIG